MSKFIEMNSRLKKGFTLIEIMIVVAIIGVLASVAIPNYMRVVESAHAKACITNLKRIDDAKALWALDSGAISPDVPAWEDLIPDYFNKSPVCPAGGTYSLNALGDFPTCDQPGHELKR